MLQVSSAVMPAAGITVTEPTIMQHTHLLHQIARSFGFDACEVQDLIGQVHAYACTHRAADCYPLRIWLSKIMVHSCTFRIGSRLFSHCGNTAEGTKAGSADDYTRYNNTCEQRLQEMPLSFRAVYVLRREIGFTTSEIALILNTTPPKVTERYAKALLFLAEQK
jgi:DNA-directed RNA polymerase specialized sigma24 family protein